MFRIGNDVWDSWDQLSAQMDALPALASFQSNEGPKGSEAFGSWADPDMLPLGRIGHPDPREGPPKFPANIYYPQRQSNLTTCEQTTLMSMWLIFRAPLFFGGDLSNTSALHPLTRALITNNETLAARCSLGGAGCGGLLEDATLDFTCVVFEAHLYCAPLKMPGALPSLTQLPP